MIGIIGGGALGLLLGNILKLNNVDFKIFNDGKVGKKILQSGNGRCNIGNIDIKMGYYHNPKFIDFTIYKDDVYETLDNLGIYVKTDEEGKFQTYLKLEAGHYKLVEISSPRNYLLNTDGLEFTIDNDSNFEYTEHGAIVTVEFANQVIKGQIKIDKKGEVPVVKDGTIIYETKSLKGVKFNIYANEDIKSADGKSIYHKKGDLVDTITTDENGYAISKELYLGKYYLVETETNDNYVLNKDKYEFELVEKDNKTAIVYKSYSALNYYKKGELEFSKEDLTTGEGIPNTKVEVYHLINEETNERELVFTGITDKEGKLKITDLFVGKFVIIETEAATGYRLSDEEVSFEIKELKADRLNYIMQGGSFNAQLLLPAIAVSGGGDVVQMINKKVFVLLSV